MPFSLCESEKYGDQQISHWFYMEINRKYLTVNRKLFEALH